MAEHTEPSAWAWAIVGRPEGLRVELPDGRAVVLEWSDAPKKPAPRQGELFGGGA